MACFGGNLESGTASSTVVVGEFDAVDVCFGDAGELAEYFCDFSGCTATGLAVFFLVE